MNKASPELQARALCAGYGQQPVLHALDCRFAAGWTAVVGPNGAGKSTLLRCLAGLMKPRAGQVLLAGRPLAAMSSRERAGQLAWLSQQGEASGELTARETVRLGRLAHLGLFADAGSDDEAAVDAAMAATECTAWQHQRLMALSGGERQRVLLARVLATGCPVLLLDEPSTHLDPPHQMAMARLLRRLGATHTVVSVLHDLPVAFAADRLLVLQQGRVVAEGAAADASLQRAVERTFDQAVRIQTQGDRHLVIPQI